jgi:hypothetical protein
LTHSSPRLLCAVSGRITTSVRNSLESITTPHPASPQLQAREVRSRSHKRLRRLPVQRYAWLVYCSSPRQFMR